MLHPQYTAKQLWLYVIFYTFSMKPDIRQQNMTTTAVKTTQNKQLWLYVLLYTQQNITSMVVKDTSTTKPYKRQQNITTTSK